MRGRAGFVSETTTQLSLPARRVADPSTFARNLYVVMSVDCRRAATGSTRSNNHVVAPRPVLLSAARRRRSSPLASSSRRLRLHSTSAPRPRSASQSPLSCSLRPTEECRHITTCCRQLDLPHGIVRVKSNRKATSSALFCSLAIFDPRVGHIMDVLSPFISILCHSD